MVLDVKEAPVSFSLTSAGSQQTFATNKPTIAENAVRNTVLGTIVARDPDAGAKLSFQLDDSAGGRFKLESNPVKCSAVTGVPVSVLVIFKSIGNISTCHKLFVSFPKPHFGSMLPIKWPTHYIIILMKVQTARTALSPERLLSW